MEKGRPHYRLRDRARERQRIEENTGKQTHKWNKKLLLVLSNKFYFFNVYFQKQNKTRNTMFNLNLNEVQL
ncbi:MAG: hypothetical protein H7836_16495, partial [Magnetococcus sp. YQC-3]